MNRHAIASIVAGVTASVLSEAAVALPRIQLEYEGTGCPQFNTIHLTQLVPTRASIRVYSFQGFIGAEFRITGLPAPSALVVQIAAGQGVASAVGDPFGLGCRVAFAQCQAPGPLTGVVLYDITFFPFQPLDLHLAFTAH